MKNEEYKRLISLWGVEHQEILMSNSILFLGSSLLILEICKGLFLSGVSNLTIIDNEVIDKDNLRNYKLYYNSCNLNDYKCKVIEEYLIRTNRNININININSIIANPVEYFYNIFLKERKKVEKYKCNDKIKTHIDIVICNLNVKDNIYIEKLCNKHNINVITCNYTNMIGYLNICLKENNHFYIHNNNNYYYNSFFFYHYIALSLFNIPEINEYVKKIDYTSFKHNHVTNKILFLIKCYKDIYNIEQEKKNIIINKNKNYINTNSNSNNNNNNINYYDIHSSEIINCNDILLYIKNKLLLTSLSFPYFQYITNEFLTLNNILCAIKKYIIQSDIHNYHNNFSISKNHISFFLIVYKSFIKENHDLPYLYDDINFEEQNINTILMKKKQQDIQKLKNIINKKKIKYSFYKPFTITYFRYFFSHFHNIRYIAKDQIKNNDELLKHWHKFLCLYEYSMDKKENKNNIYRDNQCDNNNIYRDNQCDNNNNIYRDNTYDVNNNNNKNNIYLNHTCNNNYNCLCANNHYKHTIEIKKKKKSTPILLCNNKSNDILYFYKSKLNYHIKEKIKDGPPNILLNKNIYTMYTSIYKKKHIYFVKNLLLHSHRNTCILMNSIQNINNSFKKYNETNNFCSNICLVLLMSGFITQEILKIASLYLKPHINYYFFEL